MDIVMFSLAVIGLYFISIGALWDYLVRHASEEKEERLQTIFSTIFFVSVAMLACAAIYLAVFFGGVIDTTI